ncbi:MAG: hypothetical protein J6D06_04925 [Clostridia bacterium]|nr:hypothetical protein [Clostridia bacterium]
MSENNTPNKNNGAGSNKPTPPPVVPKAPAVKNTADKAVDKSKNGANKKLLFVLIPVIVALVIGAVVLAVVLKNNKSGNNGDTTLAESKVVVVTDENGVAVTDENGVPVTYVAVTEVVKVTDRNGEPVTDEKGKEVTTVVYKNENITVNVPVTNNKGEAVTNSKGEVVTQQVTLPQNPNDSGNGSVVLGTTVVPVTDGQGNTAVDESGNLFTTIVELTSNPVTVEPAAIDFKASMGGTAEDYFSGIDTDKDGNYIAANVTNSKDGDFKEYAELNYQAPYTVLVKYDKSGNLKWRKPIGSARGTLQIMDILCNEDGTFYAVGYGKNVGGVNGRGYYDGVVYKFDKDGNELWHKIFGTSTVDMFNGATLTDDGGIVAVGTVGNNDFDAEEFGKNELESAACIVKYDKSGNLMWKNVIGGNKDYFNDVAESKDGNIFAVGNFYSGTLFANVGSADSGIVKFNAQGKYVGVAPIAGKGIESFMGITACKSGGVAVVGKSNSSDSGNTTSTFVSDLASRGGYDAYIMKYEEDLKRSFAKPFRGQYDDDLVDVIEKSDGTFIATGKSNSSSRDLKGITTRGGDDMVIASFDKYGNLSWARSFGGTQNESASAICLAKDDGYVIAGRTLSKDIDMKGISQYVNGRSVGVIAKFPE